MHAFSSSGRYSRSLGSFEWTAELAIDSKGNLWALEIGMEGDSGPPVYWAVHHFNTDGSLKTKWTAKSFRGEINVGYASGLAVGADGTVYITDSDSGEVHRISSEGDPMSSWTPQGGDGSRLTNPGALAAGGDGHLYVTQFDAGELAVLSPKGRVVNRLSLRCPIGVAVDGSNRVFVLADGGVHVYEWRDATTPERDGGAAASLSGRSAAGADGETSTTRENQRVRRVFLVEHRCECNKQLNMHPHGDVCAVFADGITKQLTHGVLAGQQELAEDGTTIGWTEGSHARDEYGQRYFRQERLIIYRNGRVIRTVRPGGGVLYWWFFVGNGKQVALAALGSRGEPRYELREIATGKVVKSYSDADVARGRLPDWADRLATLASE